MADDRTTDLWDNPLRTDGFEFIEYAAPDPAALGRLFEQMGFSRCREAPQQERAALPPGRASTSSSTRSRRASRSRSRACTGRRSARSRSAWRRRARLPHAAWPTAPGASRRTPGPMELAIPGDQGHRRLADLPRRPLRAHGRGACSIYDIDFVPLPGVDQHPKGAGLTTIDHLTHNVYRGRMDEWANFYERLFNFREVRYFDIEGKLTGLKSKAMTSPCGKIRIPINESSDDRSQIQEYLVDYRGEGIQHVALGTADIHATVETLRGRRGGLPGHARHVLRAARHAPARPQGRHRAAARATASSWMGRPPRMKCCCRSSPRT